MFTALFGAIPALASLFKGSNGGGSSAGATLAFCQSALNDSMTTANRITTQRNVALALVPLAGALGYWLGRRS